MGVKVVGMVSKGFNQCVEAQAVLNTAQRCSIMSGKARSTPGSDQFLRLQAYNLACAASNLHTLYTGDMI